MPITKRPNQAVTKAIGALAEEFIKAAPDGNSKALPVVQRKRVMRGKREQISLTMPPSTLEALDVKAAQSGVTRAGLINLAVSQYLAQT